MKRGAVALPVPAMLQPCAPRAARKSEWLRSALAHHHSPQPGVENEIVVLATGIDQYLQEVFHHLAHPNQEDAVSAEDFTVLCAVLGLARDDGGKGRGATDTQGEDIHEFQDVYAGLPCQLSFKDFHSRLCGFFRVRVAARNVTGGESGAVRLPVSEETELVEREIRLRWPRVRRRKCVSFNLNTKDQTSVRTVTKRGHNKAADDKESAPGEAAALRELVEDLRSALQGSDARCLALEVALRQERARNALNYTCSGSSDFAPLSTAPCSKSPCTVGNDTTTNSTKVPQGSQGRRSGVGGEVARTAPQRCDARDPLLRELKLIRSSRDGQLEEAIKYNHRLEEELCWAYQEARRREAVESALRKENAEIRRRAEEAREALSQGLQRVRQIQEQAHSVPTLQARVKQLETELHQMRSLCTCMTDNTPQPSFPVGAEDACRRTVDAECLQRAVEGRAASDEEEEEEEGKRPGGQMHRMREEAECCLMEVKKLISQLHGCGKGCQRPAVHHVMMSQGCLHDDSLPPAITEEARASGWKGPIQTGVIRSCGQKKWPEEEKGKLGETERAHLSLLEEKLTDALSLLLELRNKNVSRRALGKILVDTLDMCSSQGNGPSWVLQVADALCVQLSSNELLRDVGGGGESAVQQVAAPSSPHQATSANPLLISC